MPATNRIVPPMKGKNASLVFFQNAKRRVLLFKSWNVKPNTTKANDGVNGEQRDRLSKVLNFYEITGQILWQDAEILDVYLEAQELEDANVAPIDQQGAVRLQPNDGTRRSFVLVDLILDDFDANNASRSETMMVTVNMRCTDLKKAKAV